MPPWQDPRALLAALHRAAVEGAAPFDRARDATRHWFVARRDPAPAVHLFALGKAARAMAAGAVAALAGTSARIAGGVVVSANAPGGPSLDVTAARDQPLPPTVSLHVGDHPVPGPRSLAAADAIADAVRAVQPGDVALVLLSGGTTALCAAPVAEFARAVGDVTIAQARLANLADTLLESGLAIHEMNAIRRRLLRWGAGRLAVALAARGAVAIPVLAISDVIGDDPAVIGSGPCTPDPLDDDAFLALLDAHDLRRALERDTAAFLGAVGGGAPPAVPRADAPAFARVSYEVIASNRDAVAALARAARAAGVADVAVEPQPLEGEAAELGALLARAAIVTSRDTPPGSPRLVVCGGEPVVHLRATWERAWDDTAARDEAAEVAAAVEALLAESASAEGDAAAAPAAGDRPPPPRADDEPLRGGRMQALALAAALALERAWRQGERAATRVWLLAAGTDGRDGPTDAAGAIVDALVPAQARRAGRNPERDLVTGRSWFPLDAAGALLRTGPTGTNVMDVVAVLVAPEAGDAS